MNRLVNCEYAGVVVFVRFDNLLNNLVSLLSTDSPHGYPLCVRQTFLLVISRFLIP